METRQPQEVAPTLVEAPGSSAFQIKGVAYLGHLDYCQEFIPGGKERFLASLPALLRPFFQQPFLPSNWYDVFPLMAAGQVCADLLGLTYYEFVRLRAVHQAKKDIKGIYHIFFAIFSVKSIAVKLPKLFFQYFNFGEICLLKSEPSRVELERRGVPALIVPWQNAVLQGYLEVALPLAGAGTVVIEFGAPRSTGRPGAYEIVTVPMVVSWA